MISKLIRLQKKIKAAKGKLPKEFGCLYELRLPVIGLLIFLAGFLELLRLGKTAGDALFFTLVMFLGNYGEENVGGTLTVVRILALGLVGITFISILKEQIDDLILRLYVSDAHSIVVIGDNEWSQKLETEDSGYSMILRKAEDRFLKAHTYILLDREAVNLEYYSRYGKQFSEIGARVYICADHLPGVIMMDGNTMIFSRMELTARKYWDGHLLYDAWKEASEAENGEVLVDIIGGGHLAEELLYFAVQKNIFASDQRIRYHLFGASEEYCLLHGNLEDLGITLHWEEWYRHPDLIRRASRVIIASEEQETELVQMIRSFEPQIPVHVVSMHGYTKKLYEENRTFDKGAAILPEVWSLLRTDGSGTLTDWILQDDVLALARNINWEYVKDSTAPQTETSEKREKRTLQEKAEYEKKQKEKAWSELGTFTKYSNLSAADFYQTLKIIEEKESRRLSDARAGELEHIRWSNYHRMNRWVYDAELRKKPSGSRKNKALRRHGDLVPYGELEDFEQENDIRNIRLVRKLKEEQEQ